MLRLTKWLFLSFLVLATVGCGGSDYGYYEDNDPPYYGGPYPVETGGVRVILSNADLVDLLPIPIPVNVPDTGDLLFDAGVDQFAVSVYDVFDGQLIAEAIIDYFPGDGLDVVIDQLSLNQVDVVVFALDGNGNSLAETEALNVAFPAGGITILTFGDFTTVFVVGDLQRVSSRKG